MNDKKIFACDLVGLVVPRQVVQEAQQGHDAVPGVNMLQGRRAGGSTLTLKNCNISFISALFLKV